ncbi:hypothetical protein GCM10027056_16770 [Glaciibacter psychrotolerans]
MATEILHNYGLGRQIVAVGGPTGSGRIAFAEDLAEVFDEREHPVFRASLRYFHRSRFAQEAFGPVTPDRDYRHRYDYATLRRVLIDPFKMGVATGFVTQHWDPDRDTWIQPTWQTAPIDAILIVDGDFINRRELNGLWSYSIVLDGAPQSAADRLYEAEVNPRQIASAVVDNSNPAHPRRLLLDSC